MQSGHIWPLGWVSLSIIIATIIEEFIIILLRLHIQFTARLGQCLESAALMH